MREVAQLAQVSVQTVSAVINDKPEITDKTRDRVLAAIDTLGYRPYTVARSLRTRRTRTIALIISDIANPTFATMASAAEDYAHQFGYSLVLYNTHDNIEREANYIHSASQNWVDGVLFVSADDEIDGLNALRAAGIPSVAVDRTPQDYAGASVAFNNVGAGRIATEHLLDLGHTAIAHISGPLRLGLARDRLAGFQQAHEERGCKPLAWVGEEGGNWGYEDGYKGMQRLLEQRSRPTAVFAANDRMAFGAIRAIYDAGLTVPGDISVVGLDDIEAAAFYVPALTTIQQSFAQFGVLGIQLLLDIIEKKKSGETQIILEPALIVRESTAPRT
jgi:DNA-binding LacI/PurR family transcriptional regulator